MSFVQTTVKKLPRDELTQCLKTYINLLMDNRFIPETPIQRQKYVNNVFQSIQEKYSPWCHNIIIMLFEIELLKSKMPKQVKKWSICNLLDKNRVRLTGIQKQKEKNYIKKNKLFVKLKNAYVCSF